MLVDWLKHAFITKFNHVRSSVYGRFTDVLAKDVLLAGSLNNIRNLINGRTHPVLLDQSPLVARRLGFASIPLACLVIRVGAQAIGMLTNSSHHTEESSDPHGGWAWLVIRWTAGIGIGLIAWGCLVALKILLGLSLLSFSARRQSGMEQREAEDIVNDFSRSAVGDSKEEKEYNSKTTRYLSQDYDDLPDYPSIPSTNALATPFSVKVAPGSEEKPREKSSKTKRWKLEEVERWTMVKRIW